MKSIIISNVNLFKLSALLFLSLAFFYFGKRWTDGSQRILIFSPTSRASQENEAVLLSPNLNISYLISKNQNQTQILERFGIVNENGMMSDVFEIGGYDPDLVETEWSGNGTVEVTERVKVMRYEMCDDSMREYIPCLDNVEPIKQLESTDKGEKYERRCPLNGTGLNCLVPAPKGYRPHIPWPQSRDEIQNAASCRYGTTMFLIRDWPKIRGVKIGFIRRKISLGFLEVVHNLYMGQINT